MFDLRRSVALACLFAVPSAGADLTPAAKKAFDDYVAKAERSMDAEAAAGRARAVDRIASLRSQLSERKVVAVPFADRKPSESASIAVEDGLINHWLGTIFVPNATVANATAVLQDYVNYARFYAPDVAESKLLGRNGNVFDVFLRLHRQVRVKVMFGIAFTVEFNTRYRVEYLNGGDLTRVKSVSTRIAQVKDPKRSHTDEYPPDDGDGYLWRLNSYWRIYEGTSQGTRGVYLESEAISLSRSVPGFVERLVAYFTTNFPRDSMQATLERTREAITARHATAR